MTNILDMTKEQRHKANISDEDFAAIKKSKTQESATLALLVGQTIKAAHHDDLDEGQYTLELSGGLKVCFSAQGDDMTYVTMSLEA